MRNSFSDKELTFLSQMIYRINLQTSYAQVCETILHQVQYIIPYTKGIIFQITEDNRELRFQNPVAQNASQISFDENIFMAGNYRSDWLISTAYPWSSVFRQTDIRDEQSFIESPLYRDIYQPQDIYYGIHAILVHNDKKIAQVGFFRPQSQSDFSDKELFLLNTLARHMELKLHKLLNCPQPSPCNNPNCQKNRHLEADEFCFYVIEKFGLTQREAEVCYLLRSGKSNQEIAELLYISKSTLDKHLYHLYRKTNVKNRIQLVQLLR